MRREFWTYAMIAVLAITWTASDVRLRVLPEHRKEDYRGAALVAVAQARRLNGEIAWCADYFTGEYYGLAISNYVSPSGAGGVYPTPEEARKRVSWRTENPAYEAANWDHALAKQFIREERHESKPIVLVLSKPDLNDQNNAWTSLIASDRLKPFQQMNGFVLYVIR
jgi:hypothetical protein